MRTNFNDILFIGPENDNGGIGAVLNTYQKNMPGYNFIGTYKNQNIRKNIKFFINQLIKILKFSANNKELKIFHIHSASRGSFIRKSIICIIGKLFGKKVILHMHGGAFKEFYNQSSIFKNYIKFILKRCDLIICLSKEWDDFFTYSLKLKNIVTIGNPVEKNLITTFEKNRNYINILFLGKICEEKGIFELIEYLKYSPYFIEGKIKLTIGGLGEKSRLKSILSDAIFKNRIEYLGWLDGDKKREALSNCDIFILPSHFEGLPISILEAMSFGKTIIATKVGGISSIVREGYNGWLISPGELKELDEVFDTINKNPEILDRYSKNSLIEIEKFYPDIIIKKLEVEYEKIIMK